jgi:hypothetical protein
MPTDDKCVPFSVNLNQSTSELQTATEKVRESKRAYMTCLPEKERGAIALKDATPDVDRMKADARTIDTMSQFILKQLGRETGTMASIGVLSDLAKETSTKLESEIDQLKSSIRLERRRFLDASPSASTAVGGLYFTREPDNRLIIIFLSCFGTFLLLGGLIVLYGFIPVYFITNASFMQRLIMVVSTWVVALFLMYIGFFTFT